MDGVVYAAFAGTATSLRTRAGSSASRRGHAAHHGTLGRAGRLQGRNGAGIWQSGGGLVSDGPGRILLATGNGWSLAADGAAVPGTTPAERLGQAEVRLQVQPDGTLRAADFFMPYNAEDLDGWDADLSSGAPLALPPVFGAGTATPNLLFQVGKQGRIYLLDRSALGGFKNGAGGGDGVVATSTATRASGRAPPSGRATAGTCGCRPPPAALGVRLHGHLVAYRAATVAGRPTLTRRRFERRVALSSSGPVITSNGTDQRLGHRLARQVERREHGHGSQLVAYEARPAPAAWYRVELGHVHVHKFNPPGVGPNGRIYVGTRDGRLWASERRSPCRSRAAARPSRADVGTTSAPATVTVTAIRGRDDLGHLREQRRVRPRRAQPRPAGRADGGHDDHRAGHVHASAAGNRAANLHMTTDRGAVDFPLTGSGRLRGTPLGQPHPDRLRRPPSGRAASGTSRSRTTAAHR